MTMTITGATIAPGIQRQAEVRQPQQTEGGSLRDRLGSALTRIAQKLGDGFQQITHSGRYSSEAVFARTNPYVEALSVPAPGQNGIHDGGILARHGDALTDKLSAYRESCKSKVSEQQMRALVNTGEHLVNAISRGDVQGDTIRLTVDGNTYEVKSGLHTTRAISWYLAAKAAEQEILMGGDHLVDQGTMIMADPGNRLFNFLNAAPTSYGRISTHFNERHDGAKATGSNVGFSGLFSSKPAQRGIEDFQGMFPSKKGALCFDRLQGRDGQPQLFMKFESVGMPTVFRLSGHGESHESGLRKVANAFRSLGHCIKHSMNFITSRFDPAHGDRYVHKEHVVKGEPKNVVWRPFTDLLGHLDTSTPEAKRQVDEMLVQGKKHGISYIEDAIREFRLQPKAGQEEAFARKLDTLRRDLDDYHRSLGPDMGVERKGKETHVSLETYPREMFTVTRNGGRAEVEQWQTINLD